ncbi:hypothetical protein D1AOALGA4SA_7768 [Olavius algarvensis Delta 1 endosymbiont]|nr:hypothetical protein D1AOALGA4SA_7768 [Olavius algarvensis Delta 1 endosymbiont]
MYRFRLRLRLRLDRSLCRLSLDSLHSKDIQSGYRACA